MKITETWNFLRNLPPRILSQKIGNDFFAWYFDGINQIGEKVKGETREKAIENLTAANSPLFS